jgi:hypothetical protein
MSHPNPYLFQISDWTQDSSRMDFQQELVRTWSMKIMDLKDVFILI